MAVRSRITFTALRRRPEVRLLVAVGLPVLLWALDLVVSFDRADPAARPFGPTAAYAAVGYLALTWRRRRPGVVFAVVLGHGLVAELVVPGYQPTLGIWLALYGVGLRCRPRAVALAAAGMTGPLALAVADEVRRHPGSARAAAVTSTILLSVIVYGAVIGVGRWVAWSVRQRELVAQHAAAEAVTAERIRIAREMHDLVAHSLTLMVLQAAGAHRWLHREPARAEAALTQVDELGQQAVAELRRLLGLLGAAPDGDRVVPGPLASVQPAALDVLAARVRSAGLDVRVEVIGTPRPLPPALDVAVHRIVQESLTNVARYADRRHPVLVQLRWQPAHLRIEVTNHVPRSGGPAPDRPWVDGGGRGLLGMRERAYAYGGELTAGPREPDRFAVSLHLPFPEPAEPARPAHVVAVAP